MKSFEGSLRNLNFSPSTSILLNFFFPFTDITLFSSSLKLQYCRTMVLLNNLKLFKETTFTKATMVKRFPANLNAGCPKAPRDFPPRKDDILHPRRVVLGLPSPSPRVCTGVRAYANVTTKNSRIDRYQICLAMVLRWRVSPAGYANIQVVLCTPQFLHHW